MLTVTVRPEQLPAGGPPVPLGQVVAGPVNAPVDVVFTLPTLLAAGGAQAAAPGPHILRLLHAWSIFSIILK